MIACIFYSDHYRPYTTVYVTHPWGGSPISTARQPRRCQYRTIRFRKSSRRDVSNAELFDTSTIPTVEILSVENQPKEVWYPPSYTSNPHNPCHARSQNSTQLAYVIDLHITFIVTPYTRYLLPSEPRQASHNRSTRARPASEHRVGPHSPTFAPTTYLTQSIQECHTHFPLHLLKTRFRTLLSAQGRWKMWWIVLLVSL